MFAARRWPRLSGGFDTEDSELVLQLFSPPLPDG